VGRWSPGPGNKRGQMNQSEGVFLGNVSQGVRNHPREPSCAFACSSTSSKACVLGKGGCSGTQPAQAGCCCPGFCGQTPPRGFWGPGWVCRSGRELQPPCFLPKTGLRSATATVTSSVHVGLWPCGGTGSLPRVCSQPGEESIPEAACRGWWGGFCYVLPSLTSWQEAPLWLGLDLPTLTELGLPTQRTVLGSGRDPVLVLHEQRGGPCWRPWGRS